jgi:hypothetical protein
MKRLTLLASLCAVALVVVPVASASAAEETTGTCHIGGTAKFPEGLSKESRNVSYEFTGTAKCKTAEGGTLEGTTTVSGKAQLQCAVAAGGIDVVGSTTGFAPGKGSLISGKYLFELSFVAQAGVVDLAARPEGATPFTATGEAEFLTTNGPNEIVACAQSSLKSLNFEAETAGTI